MVEQGSDFINGRGSNGRQDLVSHVLRYELYRHRDISERLGQFLHLDSDPEAFNRSTWDILYYLMQCYLQNFIPTVTDIYLSTNLSKGTAISGLAELERRGAVGKARDNKDGRRRLITVSDEVAALLEDFVTECGERLAPSIDVSNFGRASDAKVSGTSDDPMINLLRQLSRELRTSLTAILGFSDMIADETLGPVQPAGYSEYARDIRSAASHLLHAMNDLVDTTLAEHGVELELSGRSPVDIQELVDTVCRSVSKEAEKRGVRLRRQWGKINGTVVGDRGRLTQAMRKLVEGAASSALRDHIIDVETNMDARGNAHIRVITPESPFVPSDADLERPFGAPDGGALLRALPLIEAIAQAHGGTLSQEQLSPTQHAISVRLPTA